MDPNENQEKRPSIRSQLSPNKLNVPHRPYQRLNEDDEFLVPRPSIILPHLQDNEKVFFELVAGGDVVKVQDFLLENADFNINCVNFQGVSALLVAVQSHSEQMVEFLLEQADIDLGDTVLHAVRDNQTKILEMLLEKQKLIAPSLEFVGVTHSSDFPDHVTPLVLAAQCGHYEIIELLIQRGHTISKPHHPNCRCPDCILQLERDDLLHAETMRLNLYRAVSNPAYICHSTHDPILAAFHLCKELRECSMIVAEFRTAYAELANDISNFAVDLIACCRSTTEMEVVLNQTNGLEGRGKFKFPRLIMALDYKQKGFVAHPNTQQIVEQAWEGGWYDWKLQPTIVKALYPFYRLTLLPIIVVMSIVTPSHQLVKHWSAPLNKMISHIAGYVLFLVLVFMESNIQKTNQKRKPPNSGLEPVIIVFVIGNVWSCIRMCLFQGPRRYFSFLWNWHAVLNNAMFLLTFLFWLASYYDAVNNDQINLERKYWHHLDPLLISEATFAIAVIMAFFRLLFFCRLNYYLGPLQISLGKMCADMAKYITIFIIIIVSFSAGLCRYYQYYDGMVQVDSNGIKTSQVSSFVDIVSTLKTFFWALLTMSPLESADVIIENLPGETEKTTIINKHTFTELVGYILFALFEVLTVVMILNMLIATMSSTFQRVTDNLDIEWTFGKTDFYLEYMMQTSFPSPLNLIPTPNGLAFFMEFLGGKGGEPDIKNIGGEDTRLDKQSYISVSRSKLEYSSLMSTLVQRYFREKDTVTSAQSEYEQLKLEVQELKNLLKQVLEED